MPKKPNQKGVAFIPILIWVVAILFTGTVAVKEELIKVDLNGNKPLVQKVDVIPSPFPVPIEALKTPTPQPVINQQPAIIQKTTPVIDPDPIITCNIHKDCGGGSTRLRSSLCSNSTCCGFSDGRWVFYESKTKCAQDQNTQNVNARRSNYVPPPGQNNQPYVPPPPNNSTSGSAQPIVISCSTVLGPNFGYGDTQQEAEQNCKTLQESAQKSYDQIHQAAQTYGQSLTQEWNQQNTTSSPSNQSNLQANQQCKNDAVSWYNSQVQNANVLYGGASSTGPAMIQIAKQQYDQKVSSCDSQYPVK